MLLYCSKCRKNIESKNSKVPRTKNERIMLLSKCAVCDNKQSKFTKEQEASGLLRRLGIKHLLVFFVINSASGIKKDNILNKELAEKLHKPIIGKFKKRKVHSTFMDNVWGADIVVMFFLYKFNKGIRFLLCIIHIYSKYAWVIPLKDK